MIIISELIQKEQNCDHCKNEELKLLWTGEVGRTDSRLFFFHQETLGFMCELEQGKDALLEQRQNKQTASDIKQ